MKLKLFINFLFLFLLCFSAKANTGQYRAMIYDDPATSIVIACNLKDGEDVTLHFDTKDHGLDKYAYANVTKRTKENRAFGMHNLFFCLKDLEPDMVYYFIIVDSKDVSQRLTFRTLPSSSDSKLSLIAGGDSRNNREARRKANAMVARIRPHAVLFGGDMTQSGSPEQWKAWMSDWQVTIGKDGRLTPIVVARGNHEDSNEELVQLFGAPSSLYYSITFCKDLLKVYTLNTESSIAGDQTSWLRNDLKASTGILWKIAQYHRPMRPHTKEKEAGNSQYTSWASLFHKHRVNLVIESDAHTTKRTWPIIPSTGANSEDGFVRNDSEGTVYEGEGGWGAPLREPTKKRQWTRDAGKFNQFKWIILCKDLLESRCVKVNNAENVAYHTDESRLNPDLTGLQIWQASNGAVLQMSSPNNKAPEVAITSPKKATLYTSPKAITFQANAMDSDGRIKKVNFLVDGVLIGTDETAPFTAIWESPSDGFHKVMAVATDDKSGVGSSKIIGFKVDNTGNVHPVMKGITFQPYVVSQVLNIRFPGVPRSNISTGLLQIFDEKSGEEVAKLPFKPEAEHIEVKTTLLKPGTYVVKLTLGDHVIRQRIHKK